MAVASEHGLLGAMRLRLLLTFFGLIATVAACSGPGSNQAETAAALPGFCDWATSIAGSVPPPPPPIDPDESSDLDRLVLISESLTDFANSVESAAAFAPETTQRSFTMLGAFNRDVAAAITGSGSVRGRLTDEAETAAELVARTLKNECGVEIEPSSMLAFVSTDNLS